MKLKELCPECGALAECKFRLAGVEWLKCGHKVRPEQIIRKEDLDFDFLDGVRKAYDYQIEGVDFIRNSGFNCLIGDAMGLGKTAQFLFTCKNYPDEMIPSLIIQRSATIGNWGKEITDIVDSGPYAAFCIYGNMPIIPPGFKFYVISNMSLAMNLESLKRLHTMQPFKSACVDECQDFKEDGSQRTKSLIKFLASQDEKRNYEFDNQGYAEGEISVKFSPIKHRVFLSGTAIKNRADEYYVALNLLRPRLFPSRKNFRYRYLQPNEKGSYTRFSKYGLEKFQRESKDFILRREKSILNLPPFRRDFVYIDVESEQIKHAYNQQLDLMSNMLRTEKLNSISLLGWLSRMRHITGLAKIPYALEFARDFFENSELEKQIDSNYPDKLAIGIHHKGVRTTLMESFEAHDRICESNEKFNPLSLSGEDSPIKKTEIKNAFDLPQHRILVANELAGGVGLNLQACANTLVLERQWNSADEEQWESRFHRNGQEYPVLATYPIVNRSIDLFYHQMVADKRAIFGETVQWDLGTDIDSLRELVDRTIGSRL